jgi:uncharacterized protein
MASADAPIETPCTQVCIVHPTLGLCIGCGRSIDEIARWADCDAGARAHIMAQLPARLAGMTAAKTGAQSAPITP